MKYGTSWLQNLQMAVVMLSLFAFAAPLAQSAGIASDRASNSAYDDGWQVGDNGGSGWGGGWQFGTSGNSGHFIGDSATNGAGDTAPPLGDINSSGRAWGVFSNGGFAAAFRPFNGLLSVGQTFMIDLDTGFVEPGGEVGFVLKGPTGDAGRFSYVGGDATYRMDIPTPPMFTDQGLHVAFSLTGQTPSGTTYSMSVNVLGQPPVTESGYQGADIYGVQVFSISAGSGADHTAFFNNIAIVPEPASLALVCLAAASLLRGRPARMRARNEMGRNGTSDNGIKLSASPRHDCT